MSWYEPSNRGFRVRWRVPGKASPAAGPVKPTREEAKRWAIEHGHDRPDIETLAELLTRWRGVRTAEGRLMPSYIQEVEERLTRLALDRRWVRLADITAVAIDQWKIDTKGVGVSRSLGCLLSVLRWGARQYDLPIDTRVLRSRVPRPPRKVMAEALLTPKQVSRIITAAAEAGTHAVALIHYLTTYGARPVTACTRLVRDVDFRAGTLTVQAKRSGTWRHALLPETLKLFATIARGRGLDEPLFLDHRTGAGWPVDKRHLATVLGSWYQRMIGVPVCGKALGGIYSLKRYAITSMLRRGMDPMTVARFTGHLSIEQVLLYARSNEASTRDTLHLLGPKRRAKSSSVRRAHTAHSPARGFKALKMR